MWTDVSQSELGFKVFSEKSYKVFWVSKKSKSRLYPIVLRTWSFPGRTVLEVVVGRIKWSKEQSCMEVQRLRYSQILRGVRNISRTTPMTCITIIGVQHNWYQEVFKRFLTVIRQRRDPSFLFWSVEQRHWHIQGMRMQGVTPYATIRCEHSHRSQIDVDQTDVDQTHPMLIRPMLTSIFLVRTWTRVLQWASVFLGIRILGRGCKR